MWRMTAYIKYIFAMKQDFKAKTFPCSVVESLGEGIKDSFNLKKINLSYLPTPSKTLFFKGVCVNN